MFVNAVDGQTASMNETISHKRRISFRFLNLMDLLLMPGENVAIVKAFSHAFVAHMIQFTWPHSQVKLNPPKDHPVDHQNAAACGHRDIHTHTDLHCSQRQLFD